MANTTTVLGRIVEITGLDSDWVWSADLPLSLQQSSLRRITFFPSAATDVMVVRSGSTTGPKVYMRDNVALTECVREYGPSSGINPALKITDCTLATPASASLVLEFE